MYVDIYGLGDPKILTADWPVTLPTAYTDGFGRKQAAHPDLTEYVLLIFIDLFHLYYPVAIS